MGGLFRQGLDGLGATDCEAIGAGLLAQPVNALSSLAYVVVGGWLLWLIRSDARTTGARAFAAALVGVGVGSFAFHGPMFAGAQFVHDLTIAGVFVVVLAAGRAAAGSWSDGSLAAAVAALVLVAAVVLLIAPGGAVLLIALLAVGAAASEVARFRADARPVSSRGPARLRWVLLGAVAAAVINVAGRTGGPLCDPESLLQGHAAWHIATAVALGAYGRIAFAGTPAPR